MRSKLVLALLVAARLCAGDPVPAQEGPSAKEEFLVRFAALVGSRDPGKTPLAGVVLSTQELAERIVAWDPGRDNAEVRQLLNLAELGEIVRQIGAVPQTGGQLSATFFLERATYDLDLTLRPSPRDPNIVVATVEMSQNGEVVSAPMISALVGTRAIVTTSAPERSLFHFYVLEVERVPTATVRELGLREAWRRTATYAVDGVEVLPPRKISGAAADYPEEAKRERIEGVVVIGLRVDAEGVVTEARVVRGLGGGLSEAALRAVRSWRFEPARKAGEPVPVRFEVTVSFQPPVGKSGT